MPLAAALLLGIGACTAGEPGTTPPIAPGGSGDPRDVNIVARDYAFVPSVVDLVPGETVTFHVINGGLDIHEAIIGDIDTQLAWEAAEGAFIGRPPGPTPMVSVGPEFGGQRIVVASGQRLDVTWTVPEDAASGGAAWFVGCHIPGHWQKGMVVPVRFVGSDGVPLGSVPPLPVPTPGG